MFNLSDKIKEVKTKIKPFERDIFIVAIIVLTAFIGFGLFRLYEIREAKTPITIENISDNLKAGESAAGGEKLPASPAGGFVASKNGAKYYYPWCSGVSRIKEENKVWFATKEQAEKSGFSPAANCKGL